MTALVDSSVVFQAPIGTRDVLPPESSRWVDLVARFAVAAERAGFGLALTPMFEDFAVYQRVGESTDVVRKEMYDFRDKGDRHVALRPEGTAGVVRAWVQHRPQLPWKAWYVGPNFRYEKPQAGRYRQHYQVGVEVLGTDDPDADVEVIALQSGFYRSLGLDRLTLKLNSLGDPACVPAYRERLVAYLRDRSGELCGEHRERYADNPNRVLDCKKPPCVSATADAPRQLDHLCDPCAAHFERVRAGLGAVGVEHVIDTRLVRGLDYYTRTTFEFAAGALDAAQNAIGGGGRYDGLVESMGGPPTPGIGFGSGIERVLLACDAEGVFPAPASGLDVFVVDFSGGAEALALTHELRAAGLRADRAFDNRSPKAQFKAADRSGARLAVVIGPDEVAAGTAGVRDLREKGEQDTVDRTKVVDVVKERLGR